jgi:Cdc6-like AAA superfamily ATPase
MFDIIGVNSVKKLLLGQNVNIYAYGCTGSGKTFTLSGQD